MVGQLLLAAAFAGAAWAAAVPVEERQSCSGQWGQCGGINYNGPTCCPSGWSCNVVNPYYSQCLQGGGGQTTTTTTTTTTTSTTTKKTTTSPTRGTLVSSSSSASVAPPPAGSSSSSATGTTSAPGGPASTAAWYPGNPFSGVNQWANSFYSSEVFTLAIPQLPASQQAAAAKVAAVPSFQWLDSLSKVPLMADTLSQIRAANKNAATPNAGIFVVYDLPNRDCAAAASNGEYSIANNGVANYKAYIDAIYAQVTAYSDIRIILVVEPDSLANMVTNLSVPNCQQAEAAYFECVNYAITKLNVPNVAMYLDAGHAGWLGWQSNLQPAAQLFAQVYKNASSPQSVRGLATNVANYNAWSIATAPSYTQGDSNYDESLYVQALSPLLTQAGWSGAHFITDQSRSGVQPTKQQAWGDWCNVIGTGFGTRPTTNTGLAIEDAFVWVKPGGECDGTSNQSAARYDYHCGYADALQPAPEAGSWFQAYFAQLLTNANPSFN